MRRDVTTLYERLRATPWPTLASSIGDFALYESLLAGCADRCAKGELLDLSRVPSPDEETVKQVELLRTKVHRSDAEIAFLEYFELLEEIRILLGGTCRQPNKDER
jgi:hypothetical protein